MLALLIACGTEAEEAGAPHQPGEYEGVEEASEALSELVGQCTFTAGTGVMALVLNGGDVALILRATDGKVMVNGYACEGATASTTKQIAVTENSAATGDQTLMVDYSGGPFATGTSAGGGMSVDLGDGNGDALKILGSNIADNYVLGTSGLAINTDAYPDVTAADVEQFVVSLGDGNDTLSGAGSNAAGAIFPLAIEIYGGAGNDSLRGGSATDVCNGGAGSDLFLAGTTADGGDELNGGDGLDTADYGARPAVTISLDGNANDGDNGGAEGDNVAADIETIKGGAGNDTLVGTDGSQTISGGGGNDTLVGGPGADTLNGDAGDDTLDEGNQPSGADVLNGGVGTDTVDYSGRSALVRVNLNTTADDGETSELDRVGTDVENALGGAGNDALTGSSVANVLEGGAGDDNIQGGDGNDILRGGDGTDTLNGGAGNDTFDAGSDAGADTMIGGLGVDLVTYEARAGGVAIVMDGTTAGGEGSEGDRVATDVENLRGGAGGDTLTGNAGDNVLEGGDGVDMIDGLGGDDIIDGDAEADVIDCGAGDGDVLLDSTVTSETGCEL